MRQASFFLCNLRRKRRCIIRVLHFRSASLVLEPFMRLLSSGEESVTMPLPPVETVSTLSQQTKAF